MNVTDKDPMKSIQPFLSVLKAVENNHQVRSERMQKRLYGESNDKKDKQEDNSF